MATKKEAPEPEEDDEPESPIVEQIVGSMDTAESMDDLWGGGKATSAKEILGIPLLVKSFELRPGRHDEFAIIDATNIETGEIIDPPISCGGKMIVAFLKNAERLGGLPFTASIVRKGRALRFVPVEEQ